MAQGIFLAGYKRPSSKKQIKDTVAAGGKVMLESTSGHGDDYDGDIKFAPNGVYFFVGPDPYRKRSFYGQIVVKDGEVKVK